MRISTTRARKQLSELITRTQDPREHVVLTRHGKAVAALVSMTELERIWRQEDRDEVIDTGRFPVSFIFGREFHHTTNQEAAEHIQALQMDRAMERAVLEKAGLRPFPGGELDAVIAAPAGNEDNKPRWWQLWRRRVERKARSD